MVQFALIYRWCPEEKRVSFWMWLLYNEETLPIINRDSSAIKRKAEGETRGGALKEREKALKNR